MASYLEALLPTPIQSTGMLPVTLIAAVWSSSMGMLAVIKGLDQIYQVPETRGYVRLRIVAVVYVILFAAVLIVAAALLVFGTTIYRFLLDHSPLLATILIHFKALAGFVLLLLFFTLLYSGVPQPPDKVPAQPAGAAFTAAGWVLFSTFFSVFVENFSNFSIYGQSGHPGNFDVLAVLLHVHHVPGSRGEHVAGDQRHWHRFERPEENMEKAPDPKAPAQP